MSLSEMNKPYLVRNKMAVEAVELDAFAKEIPRI
jgi:hypothetical protein